LFVLEIVDGPQGVAGFCDMTCRAKHLISTTTTNTTTINVISVFYS